MNMNIRNASERTASPQRLPALLAALVGASLLALTGCDVRSAEDAGRRIDQAAAKVGQEAGKVGQKIEEKAGDAAQVAREAGKDVKGVAGEVASDARDIVAGTANAAGKAADKTEALARDSAITASIKVDLAKDPRLSALLLSVATHEGEVILRGDVKSATEKERAGNIARNVAGVTSVRNEIRVISG